MKLRSFKRYFFILYPFLMLVVLACIALTSRLSFTELMKVLVKPFASEFYLLSFVKEFIIVFILSLAMNLSLSMGEMNFSLEGVFHASIFLSAIVAIYFSNIFVLIILVPLIIYILWQVPSKIARAEKDKLIISSLIFNYVILSLINYLVYTFFSDEHISSAVTKTFTFALDIKWGIVIALLALISLILLAKKFSLIKKAKIIKDAPELFRSMGSSVAKSKSMISSLIALMVSVAGFLYLFLNYNRFSLQGFTGYGFDAITVSLLAKGDFKKLIYPAFLITYIRLLTLIMQTEFSFITSIMYLLQGVLIFISILEAKNDRSI